MILLRQMALPDDKIAALCLNDLEASSTARTVVCESAVYNHFSRAQSKPKYGFDLTLAEVSTRGIDAISKRLFTLIDRALGRLTVVDLATERLRDRQRLFVEGILSPLSEASW